VLTDLDIPLTVISVNMGCSIHSLNMIRNEKIRITYDYEMLPCMPERSNTRFQFISLYA
jgi:hypothetical protein